MGALQSLRERISTRLYRDDALFLAVDAERANVAPDRRYERMDGSSSVETVSAETVQVGNQFFKRPQGSAEWETFPWTEAVVWPGNEYAFPHVRDVGSGGIVDLDGRPARLLAFHHEGAAETRNAGWRFQTQLWIDPQTHYFLRRETRGTRAQNDSRTGQPLVERYEGTWVYQSHDAGIQISEPVSVPDAS
jgi:hypothetical protein